MQYPVESVNGHTVTRVCKYPPCETVFPLLPGATHRLYCSDKCRWRHRDATNPNSIANNRKRCAEWAKKNRRVRNPNYWLLGPPPFEQHLPGIGMTMQVEPYPKWPVELRNTRALHGMLTTLSSKPHDPLNPRWSLVPVRSRFGWGVYFDDPDEGRCLAGKRHQAVLYDRDVTVTLGPPTRAKSPKVTKRGHRLVRVDTITPVVVRQTSRTWYANPTGANIHSTLITFLPRRLGLLIEPETCKLSLVEKGTSATQARLGGKYTNVGAFTGSLVFDANAVGHWLLKVAEVYGLGSKTAFGYGRIRVTEI